MTQSTLSRELGSRSPAAAWSRPGAGRLADPTPNVLTEHFRCPEEFARVGSTSQPSSEAGFFTFEDAICYGHVTGCQPSADVTGALPDASSAVPGGRDELLLPFDLTAVVTNLREERYRQHSTPYLTRLAAAGAARYLYYFLRPMLPVAARRHLQKARLAGWRRIPFPQWPVDVTVETLLEATLRLLLRSGGVREIPFIWFWPEGAPGCAVMTHDVEGPKGRDFCRDLMDIDDAFAVKSAFQIVPEVRGTLSHGIVEELRRRGFEVNVHDLNHDGYLFHSKGEFLARAARINRYAREIGCRGFRSGAMYREQGWFEAFDFSYDMSVPNVAHLEAQRGGCCTVFPHFVGQILELPLTTAQDYSLFHILGDYSITLWKTQAELILGKHGLISLITHPDYLIEKAARTVYLDLLAYVSQLRDERGVWVALPGEVDRWWRNRHRMELVRTRDGWRVNGPDSERARVAYARLDGDRLVYQLDRNGRSH